MDERRRTELRAIAERYLAHLQGCHGIDHTLRVVHNASLLAEHEPAVNREILDAAAWLHDIGRALEDEEQLSHALISARLAADILPELGFSAKETDIACRAIADHRFSAGIVPVSLEGQLLQDADRLDALGAIGIARAFVHGWDRALYHPQDLLAERRELDDARYTLDHFYTKLLKLPATLHTPAARALAKTRADFMRIFLEQFQREVRGMDEAS